MKDKLTKLYKNMLFEIHYQSIMGIIHQQIIAEQANLRTLLYN